MFIYGLSETSPNTNNQLFCFMKMTFHNKYPIKMLCTHYVTDREPIIICLMKGVILGGRGRGFV